MVAINRRREQERIPQPCVDQAFLSEEATSYCGNLDNQDVMTARFETLSQLLCGPLSLQAITEYDLSLLTNIRH